MDRIENVKFISEALGLQVANTSNGRAEVVHALEERGIGMNMTTVSRLRGGSTTGSKTVRKLRGTTILQTDNASYKDNLSLEFAQTGIESRTYRIQPQTSDRWLSFYFVEEIARQMRIDVQGARRCVRAMRTDLVFGELTGDVDDRLSALFLDSANKYLTPPNDPGQITKAAQSLSQAWKENTILGFYKALYTQTSGTSIGTWVPYEVEFLKAFYLHRVELGSHLSLFDKLVLQAEISDRPGGEFATIIRQMTGIKYDASVTETYFNVLVYGRPEERKNNINL